MAGTIEYPLARRHFRPGIRNTGPTDFSEEENSHAHLAAAGKSNRLQRQTNLDNVSVIDDSACTVPQHVGFELFAARRCVQCVHLNAAWIDEQVICRLTG